MDNEVRPEDTSAFNLNGVEHKRIKEYNPQYLGHGVESFVYELPAYPDSIVKVDMRRLVRHVSQNTDQGKPLNSPPTLEQIAQLTDAQDAESKRLASMSNIFGQEHLLEQSKHLLKVPITRDLLQEVYRVQHLQMPNIKNEQMSREAWTEVTVQKKASELTDPNHLTFLAGWSEANSAGELEDYQTMYNELTNALICHPGSNQKIQPDRFTELYPGMETILDQAREDQYLEEKLKDFVSKAIAYTNETGELLDIAGEDNISFYKDTNDSWNYHLLDALYPNEDGNLSKVRATLKMIEEKAATTEHYQFIGNAVNNVRALNGLANILGISTHITLLPEGSTISSDQLWKGIRESLRGQGVLAKGEKEKSGFMDSADGREAG